MKSKYSKLIKKIGILVGLGLASYFLLLPRSTVLNTFIDEWHIASEGLREVFNTSTYNALRFILLLIIVIGGGQTLFPKKFAELRKVIAHKIFNILDEIQAIPKLVLRLFFLILIISFGLKLFYVLSLPPSYDEAWTYLHFTRKTLYYSMVLYPAPNNHILHSILTNFASYLPFGQTTNLRIPNLLVNTLAIFLFFISFKKFFGTRIALFLTTVFTFLFPVIYYGYNSRGYSLILLAFIVCFYGVAQIIKNRNNNITHWLIYITMGAIVGFYTMPSFLYPYFTLISFLAFFFISQSATKKLGQLILFSILQGIIVFMLYLPVFIITGVNAVINNRFVKPIPREEVMSRLIEHFLRTIRFLFYHEFILLIILLLATLLLFKNRKQASVWLAFYIIGVSPIILLIHSVIPFQRTWIYLIIPVMYLLGIILKSYPVLYENRILGISSLGIAILLIFHFNHKVKVYEAFSYRASNLADFLTENQAKQIYNTHELVGTNLTYIFEEKKALIQIVGDIPLVDSLLKTQQIDYLILEGNKQKIKHYEFYKNFGSGLFLYKKKKNSPLLGSEPF